MSDEGRFHVKAHSPYDGWVFWCHYIFGDIANAAHEWEIWMGDERMALEWRVSQRSIARAREQLVTDGHLTMLNARASRGHPLRYRFEFVCPEGAPSCSAARADKGGLKRNLRSGKVDSQSSKGGLRSDSHLLLTEMNKSDEPLSSVVPMPTAALHESIRQGARERSNA